MNLTDLPAGFDDPVDSLLAFHRRLERRLATLGQLPAHLEARGVDAEAMSQAAALSDCFGAASRLHHAEEECELLPVLARRIAGTPEREAFRALRARLEADHREIERAWRELRHPIEAIAEGVARRLRVEAIEHFRVLNATHICVEESAVSHAIVTLLQRA